MLRGDGDGRRWAGDGASDIEYAFAGATQPEPEEHPAIPNKRARSYFFLLCQLQPDELFQAFKGAVKRSQAYLQVSGGLPHTRIPLGDNPDAETNETMEGGVDTMCRASIGDLKYHESVVKKYPHLVVQFEAMEDLVDQKGFGIGGIGGDERGTRVTHIVTYKTPFRVNGQQVLLSLGLGNFGIKTLFSYPFLKSIRSTIMLESSTLVIGLLRTAFQMVIKQPERAATAPSATEGVPVALMASAPKAVQQLGEISARLDSAMRDLGWTLVPKWSKIPRLKPPAAD